MWQGIGFFGGWGCFEYRLDLFGLVGFSDKGEGAVELILGDESSLDAFVLELCLGVGECFLNGDREF